MRPVLVTGGNRSGTSWLGEMLCLSRELVYIWEPFNFEHERPDILPSHPLKRHYQRVLPEQQGPMGRFMLWCVLHDVIRFNGRGPGPAELVRKDLKVARIFAELALGRKAPLFKDPIALMSAEWVAERFDARVLMAVRHPAAYVNSVRRLDWRTPVEDFTEQPRLLESLPADLSEALLKRASERPLPEHFDLVDAALCWRVFYTVVNQYRSRHPDWIVVRHEDMCRDYMEGFRRLYDILGLTWSEEVAAGVEGSSGRDNRVVQGDVAHPKTQDSRTLAEIWKGRFTPGELSTIRELSSPAWEAFYPAQTWEQLQD